MDYLLALIDKLPILKENLRSTLLLMVAGVVTGFVVFPLYAAYRNEQAILEFTLGLMGGDQTLIDRLDKAQVDTLRMTMANLVNSDPNHRRAIFGTFESLNRVILAEYYIPVDQPTPLGFQTIYLPTDSYQAMLDMIRENRCYTLSKPDPNSQSMFMDELELTHANFYVSCPSSGTWFLALYAEEVSDQTLFNLEQAVKDLEEIL